MNPIQFQLKPLLTQLARADNQRDTRQQGESSGAKHIGLDFFSRAKEINTQAVQDRKSAAKARMAELKQRIENMMRFAGIGKGNPRLVAELAKELKALVAQYGGSTGAAVGMPASDNASNTSNPSQAATAGQTGSEQASAAAELAESATSASDKTSSDEKASAARTEPSAEKTDDPHQRGDGMQCSAERRPSGAGDAGDKEFFAEVKKLSSKLKQLLAMENRQLKTEMDQRELRAAKKSIQDVAEAVQKAETSVADEQAQIAIQQGGAIYSASGEASVSSTGNLSVFA
ncbi:hypothetical protein ABHF33_08240 [Chitinibacter sp. FCG-7]|uniref:Uncharacterized protein n=1 Tax=Chitinibacter mangrovi TaxID=3153927 RepID=A0AAU7FDG3_9NEIS